MKQAFHILAKDSRRFYPEILLSVFIELVFVKLYPEQWGQRVTSMALPDWLPSVAVGLVPVGWWLVISRAIHAESLVGERQFWVTRPYRWPSLLGAKVLFIFAYVLLPFLGALCMLLMEAGFHPVAYIPGLLFEMFMALCIVVVPLVVLSAITGSFAKMTLAVLILIAWAGGTAYATDLLPTANASTDFGQWIYNTPLVLALVAIIVLQFARRRTGPARWLVVFVAVAVSAVALEGPDNLPENRMYPVVRGGRVPSLQLAFDQANDPVTDDAPDIRDAREVQVSFPIQISGISAGMAIKADNAKVSITAQNGGNWSSHWQGINLTWLPGETKARVSLKISRSFLQEIKKVPVTVELSMALTELKAGKLTRIRVPEGSFSIPGGSICSAVGVWTSNLSCWSPLRQPPLMLVAVRFTTLDCSRDHVLVNNGHDGLGWIGNLGEDPADFGITSVWTSQVNFEQFDSKSLDGRQHLCPGSTLAFAPYTISERRQQKLTSQLLYVSDYGVRSYM